MEARLWPNGECVVWKPKLYAPEPIGPHSESEENLETMRIFRMMCAVVELRQYSPLLLGLSFLTIFDSLERDVVKKLEGVDKPRAAKGSGGITSYGRRMVRNAAHLIENGVAPGRAIFATVTVPALEIDQLRKIHEGWHHVVEIYRLGLRRSLQSQGLSGELVTVSEIQEKRHKITGLPILHLHSVFVGVRGDGRFAVSLENHDDIWLKALNVVLDIELTEAPAACNLQRVRKSASGYLAKYLSKGSHCVSCAVNDGFAGWLPKHWWNCTRSLARRVKEQTRRIDDFADWLNDCADIGGDKYWKWHRDVLLEKDDGSTFRVARYGQLSDRQAEEIRSYYSPVKKNMVPVNLPSLR